MPDTSYSAFLDHYCERVAPGLWNEPFNLLSNLAFIVAAIFVWHALTQQRDHITGPIWDLGLLTGLLFAIGIGSGLWHLLANRWSLLADTIPILLFINLYLLSCLFRLFSLCTIAILSIFIFYHVVNFAIQSALPADFLNGSIFYLPTWIFLTGITIAAWKQETVAYRYYIFACMVFTISLVFRTVDQSVCTTLPVGTHFIWHLLNATTLYLLMRGLIYNAAVTQSKPLS
jgi:hypothetical protein